MGASHFLEATAMHIWDPTLYSRFERERTLPASDLCHALPLSSPARILDVGCGIGNSTAVLLERYPSAHIVGADLSEEMLETARARLPELTFIRFDASKDFAEHVGQWDVIFSNACIQWVPDHPKLLREMMGALRPGGALAVQFPMNQQEPIHRIIEELAASARWRNHFTLPRVFHTLTQEQYFDVLAPLSSELSLWQTTYLHRMPSHEHIMTWYRGTGLRPWLAQLSQEDAAAFEAEVRQEVTKAYPRQTNGEILFHFPRFFFIATP